MHYNDYLKVEDWEILDTKVCHAYNDDETPFEILNVRIGTLVVHKNTINGPTFEHFPITRWIPRSEYDTLLRNSGVVIF